ncbi:50S ribosomal protein L6 [Candidatus Woesearchaeota archaeon]|nr:50S ribosomal protein L6 [Candidatus Woesearchaeota archaeon]
MVRRDYRETLDIPDGVTVTVANGIVTAKGSRGELSRDCLARSVTITADDKALVLAAPATARRKNALFTTKAHLKNMLYGVNEGYTYKLKICSGHFPMTVTAKDKELEVKNFIGEKVPRTLNIKEGADVKVDGDIIEVTANDKELAGQVAADIENLTKRPGFDRRVFQDGIYITDKPKRTM